MNILLAQVYAVLGTVIVTCYGIPWFTAILIPLGAVYYYTQNYYRKTSRYIESLQTVKFLSYTYTKLNSTYFYLYLHFSEKYKILWERKFRENFGCMIVLLYSIVRELKRLSTVTLSPIYEHYSETLSGLMTIRAFRESHRFAAENERKLDFSQRANYSGI